jgi:ABC-type nitrate/sulfonate/bicarbonate transport system permease component
MTDFERELGGSFALGAETARGGARRRMLGAIAGIPPWAGAIIGIVILIAVWWLVAATLFHVTGSVPTPWQVARHLAGALVDPVYWEAIGATGGAALWGYVWGNLIAFFLAFIVLVAPWFDGLATQLAVVCSCIPITAIAPIVTLLSHPGSRATSIFLAALSVIFTTVVGSLLGLRAASPTQLDVISAYGGGRLTQLVKVRYTAALPSIMAALKIAAPAAFLGSVLGEYFLIGVDKGLGIMLLAAQASANSVSLWTLALISGGVAGLAYWIIGLVGRLVSPWSTGEQR